MILLNLCKDDFISIYELIGNIFNIVKLVLPFILIFFGVFDLYKSVVNVDDMNLKKNILSLVKRIIAGLAIFFLPPIILFIFESIGFDKNENSCIYNCILDSKTCYTIHNNNSNNGENNNLNNNIDYSIYINN